jgi:lauroyl/myristoyl acyltransferase
VTDPARDAWQPTGDGDTDDQMDDWYFPLLRLFAIGLRRLASDTADRLGAACGLLAWRLGVRRRVVANNLTLALGLRGRERRRIARQSYCTIGANFCQTFAGAGDPADLAIRLRFLDPAWVAHLHRHLPAPIFLTPHLGPWAAAGAALAARWGGLLVIAATQQQSRVNGLINPARQDLGLEVILAIGGARGLVRLCRRLQAGIPLGILPDQGPRPERGVPAWFLGQATWCFDGPGYLAQRTGHPLIPGFALRRRAGEYRIFVGRPLPDPGEESARRQLWLDCLSAVIARFPGSYFWQHRRFKHPAVLPSRADHPWRRLGLRLLVGEPVGGVETPAEPGPDHRGR